MRRWKTNKKLGSSLLIGIRMRIGAVSEISRLEHVLLPDPDSWWWAETRLVKRERGVWKKEVLSREKVSFSWLGDVIRSLDEVLRGEGVQITYLHFSPEARNLESGRELISLRCDPSYLACCLRDVGLFTQKYFLTAQQPEGGKYLYGDLADRLARHRASQGIDVRTANFEGGAFISDGRLGLITVRNNLADHPQLLKECGELYEFPSLDMHIDSFIAFLDETNFLLNRSCVNAYADRIEWMGCDFGRIDQIVQLLRKKGYRPIEVKSYPQRGLECVVGNLLNLGEGKVVMIDPANYVSPRLEREGIDVISLYAGESLPRLRRLKVGLRCLSLPVKRRY
jgi:hypothetical protein